MKGRWNLQMLIKAMQWAKIRKVQFVCLSKAKLNGFFEIFSNWVVQNEPEERKKFFKKTLILSSNHSYTHYFLHYFSIFSLVYIMNAWPASQSMLKLSQVFEVNFSLFSKNDHHLSIFNLEIFLIFSDVTSYSEKKNL